MHNAAAVADAAPENTAKRLSPHPVADVGSVVLADGCLEQLVMSGDGGAHLVRRLSQSSVLPSMSVRRKVTVSVG